MFIKFYHQNSKGSKNHCARKSCKYLIKLNINFQKIKLAIKRKPQKNIFAVRFILWISTYYSGFQTCQAVFCFFGFFLFFFPASILMTLILPLCDPNSAAHGHCCLLHGVTSGPETAESAAALSPLPTLWVPTLWLAEAPYCCRLSVSFVLPKVVGPVGWARRMEWEAGTPLGSCLLPFRFLLLVRAGLAKC